MQIVNDKKIIDLAKEYVCDNKILNNESIAIGVHRFAKGEFVSTPTRKSNYLYIVLKGNVKIYTINSNSDIVPINYISMGTVIGDVEFCKDDVVSIYAEASDEVDCIAIEVKRNKDDLMDDIFFLQFLLKSICDKVYMNVEGDAPAISVEERVVLYMKTQCEEGVLTGVENAALKVRCSRRQLQRVLKKLADQGKISKTGKGKYKLIE